MSAQAIHIDNTCRVKPVMSRYARERHFWDIQFLYIAGATAITIVFTACLKSVILNLLFSKFYQRFRLHYQRYYIVTKLSIVTHKKFLIFMKLFYNYLQYKALFKNLLE